jgi:hypothetical protein
MRSIVRNESDGWAPFWGEAFWETNLIQRNRRIESVADLMTLADREC